jgi:hypothetical protein
MNVTSLRAVYEECRRPASLVSESAPSADRELVWQARWFSGECGRSFTTLDGGQVQIISFGEWNREAGPDFRLVQIEIDGHRHRGCLEVDLEASGWEDHHHATNPAYENVVLHVIVHRPARRTFSRTATHREVTQVCLADHPASSAEWSGLAPARPGRCSGTLRELPADQLESLLRIAAQRRLEQKAARLASAIEARGSHAAIYEALAITLGYKNNKLPFQLLAQRVPHQLAASSTGEALLFGLAGFLEKPQPPRDLAREEMGSLWQDWWKLRAAHAHLVLPRQAWHLAGQRPSNHPVRRLGALAVIARHWKEISPALQSGDFSRVTTTLAAIAHPFWSHHTSFTGATSAAPIALLGPDRIREIFVNLALPLAWLQGSLPDWHHLPAATPNATLRVVAARLFHGEIPDKLPHKAFVQQGLLQIYQDFCLREPDDCRTCRFPTLISRLTA